MYFEEAKIYTAGDYDYYRFRIPAIMTTREGTILAFAEARKYTGRDSDQIDLFLRRSFDGGKSFQEAQLVATREGWVTGNPAPVQDASTGTIWLPFCRNPRETPGGPSGEELVKEGKEPRTVWITSSDDDGATWKEPIEITRDVKLDSWTWYATGPGHAVQLSSGRLLIPCNHTEQRYENWRSNPSFSHVIYSDDHGGRWQIGGITDPGANESSVFESADGKVCINCRNQAIENRGGPHYRRVGWSSDGGTSFSPLVRDAGLPEPICQANVCRYTREGEKDGDRNRVLFSNPGSSQKGDRQRMTVRMSFDECRSWLVSRVVFEGPSAYSDMCIADDRTICCLYERGPAEDATHSTGDIVLARFDLEWLTNGEDSL